MKDIKALIDKYGDTVRRHRIWLHQHPEISGEEKQTSSYIAAVLKELGLEVRENVGGYGVVALIRGAGDGKCVALRADMDALPVTEKTGAEFSSLHDGVMHACGHDTHIAMLLGAAYVLNELKDSFQGTVKLIFQPSEENAAASGAKRMIEDGVLEDPKVDMILGQHIWPQAPVGKVLVRSGAMMAAGDRFFITVRGRSSHGSAPENGTDAIVIAAQVISALQSVVSRTVSPLDSAVVTVGTISGGNGYNIIADEVTMEGTCRSLRPEVRKALPGSMERIAKGVAEGMGGSCDFGFIGGYPPTLNHEDGYRLICDTVRDTLGEDALGLPEQVSMIAEDFSFYGELVPAVYFWLGCHDDAKPFHALHSGSFLPEWEALPVGMTVLVNAALRFLR